MTMRLQQFGTDDPLGTEESRNIGLLTVVSKLALALVMGIAVMIVSLLN